MLTRSRQRTWRRAARVGVGRAGLGTAAARARSIEAAAAGWRRRRARAAPEQPLAAWAWHACHCRMAPRPAPRRPTLPCQAPAPPPGRRRPPLPRARPTAHQLEALSRADAHLLLLRLRLRLRRDLAALRRGGGGCRCGRARGLGWRRRRRRSAAPGLARARAPPAAPARPSGGEIDASRLTMVAVRALPSGGRAGRPRSRAGFRGACAFSLRGPGWLREVGGSAGRLHMARSDAAPALLSPRRPPARRPRACPPAAPSSGRAGRGARLASPAAPRARAHEGGRVQRDGGAGPRLRLPPAVCAAPGGRRARACCSFEKGAGTRSLRRPLRNTPPQRPCQVDACCRRMPREGAPDPRARAPAASDAASGSAAPVAAPGRCRRAPPCLGHVTMPPLTTGAGDPALGPRAPPRPAQRARRAGASAGGPPAAAAPRPHAAARRTWGIPISPTTRSIARPPPKTRAFPSGEPFVSPAAPPRLAAPLPVAQPRPWRAPQPCRRHGPRRGT
jgi:hypothetical protein